MINYGEPSQPKLEKELPFCFGTACGAIMFVVDTYSTTACSMGSWYGLVLTLSFLDVCGLS